MANYCLDSNVVSDILRGDPSVMNHFNEAKKNKDKIFIPSLVYYEIIRGLKSAGKKRKLFAFQIFYDNAEHLYLDRNDMETIDKAADIYVQLHKEQMIEDKTFISRQFQWSTVARSSLPTHGISGASRG